jgi:hypothetical protein
MSDAKPSSHPLRSIAAVFGGIVVSVALSLATDGVLHKIGAFPPLGQPATNGPLLLAAVYRTLYGILGSYIAARLAPSRPMLHALTLGFLGSVASVAGAVATWKQEAVYGPHWYPEALVVLALPTAWLGGWLYLRKLRGSFAQ